MGKEQGWDPKMETILGIAYLFSPKRASERCLAFHLLPILSVASTLGGQT